MGENGWFYLVIFFICSSFNCWDHGQFAKIYICCLNKSQDPKSWCIYHSNNFSMWHCSCNSFSSLDGSYQSVLWSLLATTIIPELTRITESRATTIYSGIRVGICIGRYLKQCFDNLTDNWYVLILFDDQNDIILIFPVL